MRTLTTAVSEAWTRRVSFSLALLASMVAFAASAMALETGELEVLGRSALEQVNQVRQDQGLPTLEMTSTLTDAAQAHAVDMLENDFYAHVAPDGSAPRDRFLEQGGSQWQVVRENIARCTNCAVPPTLEQVQSFQQGWLDSPEHRANILAEGLDSFGFGIAGEGEQIFAVQTFSGAGTPRGLQAGEESIPLGAHEVAELMAEAVNRAREREGLPTIAANPALAEVAQGLLPDSPTSSAIVDQQEQLFDLLPQDQRQEWGQLQMLSAACGGCGSEATVQDVNDFVDQWMNSSQHGPVLLDRKVTDIGLAIRVNGEGRKIAIAVTGREA